MSLETCHPFSPGGKECSVGCSFLGDFPSSLFKCWVFKPQDFPVISQRACTQPPLLHKYKVHLPSDVIHVSNVHHYKSGFFQRTPHSHPQFTEDKSQILRSGADENIAINHTLLTLWCLCSFHDVVSFTWKWGSSLKQAVIDDKNLQEQCWDTEMQFWKCFVFAAYLPQSLLNVKLFLSPFDFISPRTSYCLLVSAAESTHSVQRTFLSILTQMVGKQLHPVSQVDTLTFAGFCSQQQARE